MTKFGYIFHYLNIGLNANLEIYTFTCYFNPTKIRLSRNSFIENSFPRTFCLSSITSKFEQIKILPDV